MRSRADEKPADDEPVVGEETGCAATGSDRPRRDHAAPWSPEPSLNRHRLFHRRAHPNLDPSIPCDIKPPTSCRRWGQ